MYYLQIWNPSVMFNVASVLASCHPHVSTLSPTCGPRISDEPISFSLIISNINYRMIVRACGTSVVIKNSIAITLEGFIGINVNGMRTIVVNTFRESINTIIIYIDKVVSSNIDYWAEGFACVSYE